MYFPYRIETVRFGLIGAGSINTEVAESLELDVLAMIGIGQCWFNLSVQDRHRFGVKKLQWISTLVAGRIARLGSALAHGACAWVAIVTTATLTRTPLEPWHGLPAAAVLFVLIEDMVLLGRLGRRRRSNR